MTKRTIGKTGDGDRFALYNLKGDMLYIEKYTLNLKRLTV